MSEVKTISDYNFTLIKIELDALAKNKKVPFPGVGNPVMVCETLSMGRCPDPNAIRLHTLPVAVNCGSCPMARTDHETFAEVVESVGLGEKPPTIGGGISITTGNSRTSLIHNLGSVIFQIETV